MKDVGVLLCHMFCSTHTSFVEEESRGNATLVISTFGFTNETVSQPLAGFDPETETTG